MDINRRKNLRWKNGKIKKRKDLCHETVVAKEWIDIKFGKSLLSWGNQSLHKNCHENWIHK